MTDYTIQDAMRDYPKAVEAVMMADGYEWMTNRYRVECWARPTIVGSYFRVAGDEADDNALLAACVRYILDRDSAGQSGRWYGIYYACIHGEQPLRSFVRAVANGMEDDDA